MSSTGNAEEIRTNKREEKTPCNCPPRGGAHAIPYNAIQYHSMPYKTLQFQTMPYNAMQCHTILAIPYNTLLYLAIPCNTIQYPAVSCPPKDEPGKEQVPMQPGAGKIKKFCTEYLYCVKTFTARYGIFLLLVRLSF